MISKTALALIALATAACHSTPEVAHVKDAAAPGTALVGSWTGPCIRLYPQPQPGGFVDTTTQQSNAVFTAANVTLTAQIFRQLDCADLNYVMNVSSSYAQAPADATGLMPVDYTLSSITITYIDPTDIDDMNDAQLCGYSNWQVNVPQEVSGRQCFDDDPVLPTQGSKLYDVAEIDSTGKLYFGLASQATAIQPGPQDGSSPANRPTSVNTSSYLTPTAAPAPTPTPAQVQ